ncbi:uncharacterized protein [Haliotis cracherodii]|uniref:uncharacterized protein n=1 Tax=Haliotis cracherodii TaxID=6455 RepID=UPI0039E91FF2
MATLPPDLRKSRGSVIPQGWGPRRQDRRGSNHVPRSLSESKQFHAYFCQDNLDSIWTRKLIDELEGSHGFKCAEYHRDLVVGERVLDLMTMFIFTADRIVFILSENFLKSNYAMYQLQLAVQYDIDHDTNNIVALHVDECKVPSELLTFQIIDTKSDGWKDTFLDYLKKPAPQMPNEICTNGTHVSVQDLCRTQRSVISDPPTLRPTLQIPEYIRTQIKIWHKSKFLDDNHLRKAVSLESSNRRIQPVPTSDLSSVPSTGGPNSLEADDRLVVEYHADQVTKSQATLLHALNIRVKDKFVYEARESRLTDNGDELNIQEGDVLEMLHDEPTHGNMYKCKNAQGHVGFVPNSLMSPSFYLLPSRIVKQFKQTISASENEGFRKELEQLGISYFVARSCVEKTRGDIINLSVKNGDVLLQLKIPNEGLAIFKNCRNETGYLPLSLVDRVNVPKPPLESRVSDLSNISIVSEGYASEASHLSWSSV